MRKKGKYKKRENEKRGKGKVRENINAKRNINKGKTMS